MEINAGKFTPLENCISQVDYKCCGVKTYAELKIRESNA